MKKIFTFFTILLFLFVSVYGQNTSKVRVEQLFSTTKKLNSAGNNLFGGKNREAYRVFLPPNTLEWFYIFRTVENENSKGNFNILEKFSGINLYTAVASVVINEVKGTGGMCDIYLTDGDNKNKFIQGKPFSYKQHFSREKSKEGHIRVQYLNEGDFYLCLFNENLINSVSIAIEVYAIVEVGLPRKAQNEIFYYCKSGEVMKNLSNSDNYCQCVVDKFQDRYNEQMTKTEFNRLAEIFAKECLVETGEINKAFNKGRTEAVQLARQGNYGDAIEILIYIINNGNSTIDDYNKIGFYYIFTKQYLKAIKYLKEGEKMDETELLIKGNLAHAYLFNGDIELAKSIYAKYKNQNVTSSMSWVDMVKSDFKDFEKAGLPTQHFDSILKLIQ